MSSNTTQQHTTQAKTTHNQVHTQKTLVTQQVHQSSKEQLHSHIPHQGHHVLVSPHQPKPSHNSNHFLQQQIITTSGGLPVHVQQRAQKLNYNVVKSQILSNEGKFLDQKPAFVETHIIDTRILEGGAIPIQFDQKWEQRVFQLEQEIEFYKRRCQELELTQKTVYVHTTEKEVIEMQTTIETLKQEMTQITTVYNAKENECHQWRQAYQQLELTINQIQQGQQHDVVKIQQSYMLELQNKQNEIEDWKNRAISLEQTLKQQTQWEVVVTEYENRQHQLVAEIESWKQRYQMLDQERIRVIEDLRKNYEYNRQTQLENIKKHSEQQKIQLEGELKRLKEQLEFRMREIEDWRLKLQEGEKNNYDMRCKVSDYENKIHILTSEIERQNDMMTNKGNEWENLKNNYLQLELQLQKYQKLELEFKQTLIQLEEARKKLQLYEQQFMEYRKLDQYKIELENKTVLLSQEIERLNVQLRAKSEENEQYRAQFINLEQEINNYRRNSYDLQMLEQKMTLLQKEIDRLHGIISTKDKTIDNLQLNISQYEMQINQLKSLEYEIRKLQEFYETKVREVEEWKNRYAKLETQFYEAKKNESKIQILENKVQQSASDNNKLNDLLKNKHQEYEQLYSQLIPLQQTLKNYEIQLLEKNNLTDIINQLQRENEENKKKFWQNEQQLLDRIRQLEQNELKFFNLKSENERLQQFLSSLQEENDRWRQQYQQIEMTLTQYKFKDTQLIEYENKLALLSQEIERLNILLKNKIEDNENLTRNYQNLQRSFQNIEFELSQSKNLNAELSKYQQYVTQLEIQIKESQQFKYIRQELENKIVMLSSEIERLNLVIKSTLENSNEYKNKISKLEFELQDIMFLKEKNQILNRELERLQQIIDELNRELEVYRFKYADSASLMQKIEEQLTLMVILFAEIDSLRMRVIEKEKEVQEVRRSSLAPYRK